MTERGYILGSAGATVKRTKDQEIWDLDEEQSDLYRRQLLLRYKRPSREKDNLAQEEIDLLWIEVRIYETYGDEERKLRDRAIDVLRQYEKQLFGKVKNIAPAEMNDEESQSQSSRWRKYKAKMIRSKYLMKKQRKIQD